MKVSTKSLASVFGRALFVESQFMGKAGKLALAELRSMEKTNKSVVTLSEVQSEAMHNLWKGMRKEFLDLSNGKNTTSMCCVH